MSDLSNDARDLFEQSRETYEPRRADQLRVRMALAAAIPAGASAAAAGVSGAVKVVVFVVSVAVGSVGVVGGAAAVRASRAPAMVEQSVAVQVAPVKEVPPAVEALPAPPAPVKAAARREVVPVPSPPVVVAPPAAVPAPAPVAVKKPLHALCEPAAELELVQRAQRWLASDAPLEALRELNRFDDTCAEGRLVEERLATRAIALCVSGRADDGRAQQRLLEARNDSSPALSRVRSACAP